MNPIDRPNAESTELSPEPFEEFLRRFQPRSVQIEISPLSAPIESVTSRDETRGLQFLPSPTFDPIESASTFRSWTGLVTAWACGMVMGAGLMFSLAGKHPTDRRSTSLTHSGDQPQVPVEISDSPNELILHPADDLRLEWNLVDPLDASRIASHASESLLYTSGRGLLIRPPFVSAFVAKNRVSGQEPSTELISNRRRSSGETFDPDSTNAIHINFEPSTQPKSRQAQLNELLTDAT